MFSANNLSISPSSCGSNPVKPDTARSSLWDQVRELFHVDLRQPEGSCLFIFFPWDEKYLYGPPAMFLPTSSNFVVSPLRVGRQHSKLLGKNDTFARRRHNRKYPKQPLIIGSNLPCRNQVLFHDTNLVILPHVVQKKNSHIQSTTLHYKVWPLVHHF